MPPKSRIEPAEAAASAQSTDVPVQAVKKSAKRRTVPVETYNAFILGLEIVSIRLVRASIEAESIPEHRRTLPKTHLVSARYTNADEQVVVIHELAFTGTYEGESAPEVSVRAEFEVRYSSAQRMTKEIFAEFRRRNLPYNTWPYFREFVHAALARVGWPMFVLPVYKGVGPSIPVSAPAGQSKA